MQPLQAPAFSLSALRVTGSTPFHYHDPFFARSLSKIPLQRPSRRAGQASCSDACHLTCHALCSHTGAIHAAGIPPTELCVESLACRLPVGWPLIPVWAAHDVQTCAGVRVRDGCARAVQAPCVVCKAAWHRCIDCKLKARALPIGKASEANGQRNAEAVCLWREHLHIDWHLRCAAVTSSHIRNRAWWLVTWRCWCAAFAGACGRR